MIRRVPRKAVRKPAAGTAKKKTGTRKPAADTAKNKTGTRKTAAGTAKKKAGTRKTVGRAAKKAASMISTPRAAISPEVIRETVRGKRFLAADRTALDLAEITTWDR